VRCAVGKVGGVVGIRQDETDLGRVGQANLLACVFSEDGQS
jgi:hypothetical protein